MEIEFIKYMSSNRNGTRSITKQKFSCHQLVHTNMSRLLQNPPQSQLCSVSGKRSVGPGSGYSMQKQRREQGHSLNAPEGKTIEKQAFKDGQCRWDFWCPHPIAILLCSVGSGNTWGVEGWRQTMMWVYPKHHCFPGSHARRKMAGFVLNHRRIVSVTECFELGGISRIIWFQPHCHQWGRDIFHKITFLRALCSLSLNTSRIL